MGDRPAAMDISSTTETGVILGTVEYLSPEACEGERLDEIEVLIDFLEVKKQVREILSKIDYTFLNENPEMAGTNPSAEVVACWIFQKVRQAVDHPVAKVAKVTVWETEDCAASYSE